MLVNSVPLSLTHSSGLGGATGDDRIQLACDLLCRIVTYQEIRHRHSRVKSSTTTRMRNRRPSVSVSEAKSSDQRWFGPCGKRHRCPCADRSLAPAAAAHLQSFLGIQPTQLLVVHADPLAFQQQLQSVASRTGDAALQVLSAASSSLRHRRADAGSAPHCDRRR